jgi:hypothetical protein
MKTICSLLFAIIMVFPVSQTQGAEWVHITRNAVGNEFFYDRETLTKLPAGIMKVRSMEVYSDEGKKEYIQEWTNKGLNAKSLKKLNHAVDLVEIDCSTRGLRIMATSEHSIDGVVLDSSTFTQQPSEGWASIPPGSSWEELYKAICPSQKKR